MTVATRLRPSSCSLLHDIKLTEAPAPAGGKRILATIECERRGCTLNVDVCRSCPRFDRI